MTLNADTGGLFSYTDLYLMGYVSRMEMDDGNSELRYMGTPARTTGPSLVPIEKTSEVDTEPSDLINARYEGMFSKARHRYG